MLNATDHARDLPISELVDDGARGRNSDLKRSRVRPGDAIDACTCELARRSLRCCARGGGLWLR